VLTIDNGQGKTASESVVIDVREDLPVSDISVEYKDGGNGNSSDNMINPHLRIANNGSSAIAYQDLSIRYWFTSEDTNSLNFWCDWAQLGTSNVTGVFGEANGMDYLEVSFGTAAGNIGSAGNSGDIQTRFAKTNWSPFDETNDYSYNGTITSYTATDKVTLYLNGTLVWGVEPAANFRNQPENAISKIVVTPNPVVDNLILRNTSSLRDATIKITNLSGRVFYTKQVQENTKSISLDFNELQAGVYFVQIIQNENITVRQVVK